MSDKMKTNLFTLIKSVGSALIVFLSALLADKFGTSSASGIALGASVATMVLRG